MRTDLRPLALLLSISLLTGCAVGPDYRSPEIDVSPRFLGQEAVAHRDVQSKADLEAWWAGFDDPLLTRLISLALEQNLDIAQAAARVAQSRASLRQADAALLPSANVNANAARSHQSVETPLGQLLTAARDFDRNGSYYEANVSASWEVDVFGGYTAGAGHQLYTARAFPKPYWNRIAFINEPTAHLVGQGIIEKRGAGFVTRDGWNLLAGAEEWVAPVQAQVGPDGAVWVSDWYNFIGQHNLSAVCVVQVAAPRPVALHNHQGVVHALARGA